jgi:hypothetical protein
VEWLKRAAPKVPMMFDTGYETWLLGRMSPQGFAKRRAGSFGELLTVDLFYRTGIEGSGELNPGPPSGAFHP